jgi:hypothetical protein
MKERSNCCLIVANFPLVKNDFQPYMAILNSNVMDDKQFAFEQIKNFNIEQIEAKSKKSISMGSVKVI